MDNLSKGHIHPPTHFQHTTKKRKKNSSGHFLKEIEQLFLNIYIWECKAPQKQKQKQNNTMLNKKFGRLKPSDMNLFFDSLENTGHIFYRMSLHQDMSDVFL